MTDAAQILDTNPGDGTNPDALHTGPATILVTNGYDLVILNLAGDMISTIPVPAEHREPDEPLRGVVEDGSGRIHLYAGTFAPRLATFEGGSWSSRQVTGWGTQNVVHYGHLAARGDIVVGTIGFGAAAGLMRYDAATTTASVVPSTGFSDVTLGVDNTLYALSDDFDEIRPIDPVSLLPMEALPISPSPDLITVDGEGDVRGTWTQSHSLWTFPRDGSAATQSMSLGTSSAIQFQDLDLASDGKVIFCGDGKLVITDLALSEVTIKSLPYRTAFCAFGYAPR